MRLCSEQREFPECLTTLSTMLLYHIMGLGAPGDKPSQMRSFPRHPAVLAARTHCFTVYGELWSLFPACCGLSSQLPVLCSTYQCLPSRRVLSKSPWVLSPVRSQLGKLARALSCPSQTSHRTENSQIALPLGDWMFWHVCVSICLPSRRSKNIWWNSFWSSLLNIWESLLSMW